PLIRSELATEPVAEDFRPARGRSLPSPPRRPPQRSAPDPSVLRAQPTRPATEHKAGKADRPPRDGLPRRRRRHVRARTHTSTLLSPAVFSHGSAQPLPLVVFPEGSPIHHSPLKFGSRALLQGSHRGAEGAVPVEERPRRHRRLRVPAPEPPGAGHEGACLGAAGSAPPAAVRRRRRPHAQGHRPRPPERGRPRQWRTQKGSR
ncbi:unnamed protein product, partial [Urochloa humidicola]